MPRTGNRPNRWGSPRAVAGAVSLIKRLMPAGDMDKMSGMSRRDLISLHHGFGTWIRNNFGLWRGNRSLLLDCERIEKPRSHRIRGMMHPDDASTTITRALWRSLRLR